MIKFNKRKWWHFSKNRGISIEISGFNSSPSAYIRIDGDEGELKFHIGLFIGVWLTFERFLPRNWYPQRWSKYTNSFLPEEREIYFAFHGGCFWWDLWVSEEWSSYSANKTWRKGCWHIVDRIKGKHEYKTTPVEVKEYKIPFLEGNYNVLITKSERVDTWKRWFTRKMLTFNVKVGYYDDNKNWVAQGVPVEGKGENSWDCGEDATYEMSFPGAPYRKEIKSTFDAALYFWRDMMKSRERYGSAQWLPEKFRKEGVKVVA